MQPGETITPGTQPPNDPVENKEEALVAVPEAPNNSETAAVTPEPATGWQFSEESQAEGTLPEQNFEIKPVTWTASEYIAHNKGMGWFILLGLGLFALVALIYLATRDLIATIMVGIAGATFAAFSVRPPRTLDYTIDRHGVKIDQKFYPFEQIKSFALSDEGPLPSLMLLPMRRFLPPITIFYDPKAEDDIIDMLGTFLPHEEKEPDFIDRLMARIRF